MSTRVLGRANQARQKGQQGATELSISLPGPPLKYRERPNTGFAHCCTLLFFLQMLIHVRTTPHAGFSTDFPDRHPLHRGHEPLAVMR